MTLSFWARRLSLRRKREQLSAQNGFIKLQLREPCLLYLFPYSHTCRSPDSPSSIISTLIYSIAWVCFMRMILGISFTCFQSKIYLELLPSFAVLAWVPASSSCFLVKYNSLHASIVCVCVCVFFFFLYWSVVDLQYYTSFKNTTQWFNIFIDYTPYNIITK